MSETGELTDLISEWQLQVNELATNLLLNGPGKTVISGLKELSEAAGRAGYNRLAQAASQVIETLPEEAEATSEADEVLRKGLATIQQILSEPVPVPALQSGEVVHAAPIETPAEAVPKPVLYSLAQDAELVGDFITESREHLGSIENNMLTLEKNPNEKEAWIPHD
jgi:HPt (histidine-containing phosphotransfer) domain-containing protein